MGPQARPKPPGARPGGGRRLETPYLLSQVGLDRGPGDEQLDDPGSASGCAAFWRRYLLSRMRLDRTSRDVDFLDEEEVGVSNPPSAHSDRGPQPALPSGGSEGAGAVGPGQRPVPCVRAAVVAPPVPVCSGRALLAELGARDKKNTIRGYGHPKRPQAGANGGQKGPPWISCAAE